MKTYSPATLLAVTLLTAALVGGTTPVAALTTSPEGEPLPTATAEPAPSEPAAPGVFSPDAPDTAPAPTSPPSMITPPENVPARPAPAESGTPLEGADPQNTESPALSPEEYARNAAVLAEVVGPHGASLGQGVERIAETGDPQVPTEEELARISEDGSGSAGSELTPPSPPSVQGTDKTGITDSPQQGDFPMAEPSFQAMINYWKPAGILGVDVSSWQGNVDWAAAWRQGSRFAYTKATQALNYTNPYFRGQYSGAEAVGMDRGAYHFAIPNVSSGAAQADFFLRNGGGWTADGKTLPPLLDVEYNPYPELGNRCYNMSPTQMVNWIRDFSNTMLRRTGRLPMIYSTTDWWNECTGSSTAFANHPLHIAAYNTCCTGPLPAGWRTYSLWQYTHEGPIVGDWNQWNGSAAGLDRFVRNTTTSTPAPAPAPVLDRSLMVVNAGDFNGNGTDDLLSRRTDGTLWFQDGAGNGSFRAPVQVGSGWGTFSQLIGGQDFNGDGRADVVGRRTDGTLWFYAGTGQVTSTNRGLVAGVKSGSGWNIFDIMISTGDFTGDRRADLIARKPDGTLWLYPGTGTSPGIVTNPIRIGTGWTVFNMLVGAGDYTGDGRADLLARKSDGTLWLYQGTGIVSTTSSGSLPGRIVGTGWSGYADVVGASDFNGDNKTDLVGYKADKSLWFFAGTVTADNGLKPAVRTAATGWQAYTTVLSPGDYNSNGTKDLIGRRKDGTLWFFDGTGRGGYRTALKIGSGWNAFDQIMAPGDFNADGKPDLLARRTDGSLWFYAGTGAASTKAGHRIGSSGWQSFNQLMTPGDYNSDGKPDLMGRKPDGSLWFWPGTGSITATTRGYGTAARIGASGWQNFTQVVTPGDFNGDRRNDLLATKPDGTLWFYAGTGNTSTEPGRRIGVSGWTNFTNLLGSGDITGDAKPDLLGTKADGSLWLYAGTGMPTTGSSRPATPAGRL